MNKTNKQAFDWIQDNFPFENYIPQARMSSYFEMPDAIFKYCGTDAKILDFGAGPCDKTAMLSLRGFDVTAYDDFGDNWYKKDGNKDKILEFAKNSGINYKMPDKDGNFNFEEKSFDVLILNNIIEHLHNSPRDFINELLKFLKPGGYLIVDVPNAANFRKRIDLLLGRTNYPSFSSYYWSPNPWRGHNREYVKNDLVQLNDYLKLNMMEVSDHHYHLDKLSKFATIIFKLICKIIPGVRESWIYVGQKPEGWMPNLIPSQKELEDANKKNYFKG